MTAAVVGTGDGFRAVLTLPVGCTNALAIEAVTMNALLWACPKVACLAKPARLACA